MTVQTSKRIAMLKSITTAIAILIFGLVAPPVSANCLGEIDGPLPNQIGTIMLFSSRGGGAKPQYIQSEFWAVTGTTDTRSTYVYPVRFTDETQKIVDGWDWGDLALSPPIVTVLVDGEIDGDFVWLNVRKLLLDRSDIDKAQEDYPNALKGKCPPLFRRR